jgi:hypothetical protein
MDRPDVLALYPFVVVRIACKQCSRAGAYRLARLAAKMGPETLLDDVLRQFSYDCLWREESRAKAALKRQACGVYFPDLEQPRPPDMPPGLARLRLVKGGKAS